MRWSEQVLFEKKNVNQASLACENFWRFAKTVIANISRLYNYVLLRKILNIESSLRKFVTANHFFAIKLRVQIVANKSW